MYWMTIKNLPQSMLHPKTEEKRSDAFSVAFILRHPGLTFLKPLNYVLTLHLCITPALPYIFQFHNQLTRNTRVLSAGFRNALLIG